MFWFGTTRSILNTEKELRVEIFIKELFLMPFALKFLIETNSEAVPNKLMFSLHSRQSISYILTFDITTDFKGFIYWAELFIENIKICGFAWPNYLRVSLLKWVSIILTSYIVQVESSNAAKAFNCPIPELSSSYLRALWITLFVKSLSLTSRVNIPELFYMVELFRVSEPLKSLK
jgi:hypothetical protein